MTHFYQKLKSDSNIYHNHATMFHYSQHDDAEMHHVAKRVTNDSNITKQINISGNQALSLVQNDSVEQVSLTSTAVNTNAIKSKGRVEVKLNRSNDRLKWVYVAITVTNGDGALGCDFNVFDLIDFIEFKQSGSGSCSLGGKLEGKDLYLYTTMFLNPSEE